MVVLRGPEAEERQGNMTDTTFTFRGATLALALALTGPAGAAFAQDSTNQVAVKTDWSVFTEESPKECWGVSAPKETVNSRDGKPVSVQRSEIRLFVTFRPGTGAAGEVSFTGGYPFAKGSTVNVTIDGDSFELFTDGEWAWPGSTTDDAAILASLKKGSTAVVSAKSGKGTKTVDTFSLRGFTAAMAEAETRCK
jgi:Invasion associated locus B (IalB) protein